MVYLPPLFLRGCLLVFLPLPAGDPNKPLTRPGHIGIRTRDGYKLILYYDLRFTWRRQLCIHFFVLSLSLSVRRCKLDFTVLFLPFSHFISPFSFERCYPEKWQRQTAADLDNPLLPSNDNLPPAGPWELFDLNNDPQERVNVFDQLRTSQPSLVAALMVLGRL
jgi:hypothetical protein